MKRVAVSMMLLGATAVAHPADRAAQGVNGFVVDQKLEEVTTTISEIAVKESGIVPIGWSLCRRDNSLFVSGTAILDSEPNEYSIDTKATRTPGHKVKLETILPPMDNRSSSDVESYLTQVITAVDCSHFSNVYSYRNIAFYEVTSIDGYTSFADLKNDLQKRYGSAEASEDSTGSKSGGLTPTGIRTIQQELQKLDLYDGNVDGVLGPQTAEAIRAFQEQSGLRPTGQLNTSTVRGLYVRSIKRALQSNWYQPAEFQEGDVAEVEVSQIRSGDVTDVTLHSCSGGSHFCDSVVTAVERASPLPQAPTNEVFARHLQFTFRPEAK